MWILYMVVAYIILSLCKAKTFRIDPYQPWNEERRVYLIKMFDEAKWHLIYELHFQIVF